MTGTQHSLSSFETESESASDVKTGSASSSDSKSSPDETDSRVDTEPLETVYTDVSEYVADVPEVVRDYSCAQTIETPETYANTRLPDELPAVPLEIGDWELVARDDGGIYYGVRGEIYDRRFGQGGGFQRVFVNCNGRAISEDVTFCHRQEEYRGFGNPDAVKSADLSETGELSVWGFSPKNNNGDSATFSGPMTDLRCGGHETVYGAVTALIVCLIGPEVPCQCSTPQHLQ